jgi:hypothetical protein
MNYIKPYWGAGLSVIAIMLFFSPWIIDLADPLGPQILSMYWFLFGASVIFCGNLVAIILMVKKNRSWNHYAISNGIIAICFVAIMVLANTGYLAMP